MVIGALGFFGIACLPIDVIAAIIAHFVGIHSSLVAMAVLPLTLISMAYGATWFKHLFYRGLLWGYKPDKSL